MGVDVRGKIALARYFGGYRGGKSLEGEKRGVAAILVYSDPRDDGWFQGPVYPDGPWGPASHVQRGANVYDFLVPGDPLTPGWPSTASARRIAESESTILPKLPMMPLSARDAAEILRRLSGPAVPPEWQGVAIADTYRIGPGPVRVRLQVENTRERRTIRNVIGVLEGTDEPEQKGDPLQPPRRVGLRRRRPVLRDRDDDLARPRARTSSPARDSGRAARSSSPSGTRRSTR